ncbi:hypothetical protein TWF481_008414 [Arthrobotrys musiformis]|uniref:DUF427 domain-containing protein n=1 Tax=Arthrobotrys musiformis TaxID=47236 RepID=A0AAV9W952_9PEZI
MDAISSEAIVFGATETPEIQSAQDPVAAIETPQDGTGQPQNETEKSKDGTEKPEDGTEKPEDGTEKPEDGTEKPEDGTEKPKDGIEKPKDGAEKPKDGTEKPKDETRTIPRVVVTDPVDSSDYLEKIGTYKSDFPRIGHYEICEKRIRAWLRGEILLDTDRAVFVWENSFFPALYVPRSCIFDRAKEGARIKRCGNSKRNMDLVRLLIMHDLADHVQADWAVLVDRQYICDAILIVDGRLKGYIRIPFKSVDEWREHENVIVGYPKDPYKAVSLNQCSRLVEFRIGTENFKSDQTVVLTQKGYPPRFYFMRDIFKVKLPSGQKLAARDPRKNGKAFFCPYKGQAVLFDLETETKDYRNLCWRFICPPPDVHDIKDRYCFNTRLLDSITVDGVPLLIGPRPGDYGMSEQERAMFFYDA